MTYYVKTDDPTFTKELKAELEDHGLTESSDFPVDLVFVSGKHAYYKNHIDLKKSRLTNTVHPLHITNKYYLSNAFKDQPFILDTQLIKQIPDSDETFLKILKPTNGYSGEGISIVTNYSEVQDWIEQHDYMGWILQDYIRSPALKNGYKFHLRVPILVVKSNIYVCTRSPYYLAEAKYTESDWGNTDIHDTHYKSGKQIYYPDELPDGWKRKTDIFKMFEVVFKGLKLKPDWGGKNPYYLFGADVMFDKRKPILLEVNEKIGLKDMEFVIPGMVSILLGKDHPDFIKMEL